MLRHVCAHFRSQSRHFWSPPRMVENTGSIARDILAAERTFLAWARTGLGFVGAGSALFAASNRYSNSPDEIVPACALLIANGAFLLIFSTKRYLTVVSALQKDKFLVDTRGTLAAVLATSISTVTSLGLALQAELTSETSRDEQKDVKD